QSAESGLMELMKAGSLPRFVGRSAGIGRSTVAGLRSSALRWLLCFVVGALGSGAPDLAWGQYRSGGYSRPGGGDTSSYSASSRRAPVASSGGYSRRSYYGGGYSTGSSGDRAVSRSLSSQAFRDYRAAQRPADTYPRRPLVPAGGSGWSSEAQQR